MNQSNFHEIEKFANVGAWEYRLNSRELTWSPNMYSIFGRSAEQGSLSLSLVLESIHGPDRIKWELLLNQASVIGTDGHVLIRIINSDNEVKWIKKSATGIFVNGELVGMKGLCQDITHERRLQEYFDTTNDLLNG